MTTRIALIGANGHGRHHRRHIAGLTGVRLVGLADPQPVDPDPPVPDGARVFADYRELLAEVTPDVVVICTPPHTHLAIAEDVLRSGADVLLEKPPVRTLAEHHRLAEVIAATGRACQVGFQALGSQAAARLWELVAAEQVTAIAAVASWQRDDAYYERAPWAGRRQVEGRPVIDGVLVNPLAHALMQALETARVAGAGDWETLEIERYRTRPIEADDTAFLRLTFASGLRLVVAATLAGEDFIAGEIVVDSSAGRAVLEYPTDRLLLPTPPAVHATPPAAAVSETTAAPAALSETTAPRAALSETTAAPGRVSETTATPGTARGTTAGLSGRTAGLSETTGSFGRTGLLENLIAHREAGVPLVAPLERTAVFTSVLEAITAPDLAAPTLLTGASAEDRDGVRVIAGVNSVLRRVAETGSLPAEWGVPWAVPAYRRSRAR